MLSKTIQNKKQEHAAMEEGDGEGEGAPLLCA
jgi:hypothetical protein